MTAAAVRLALPRAAMRRLRPASARWSAAVVGVSALAMVAIYHHLWADPSGRLPGSAHHGNDPMQMMWFLRWVPWSILHGHNPFATDYLFYPHGVALTWNTFVPTLGILAAPITLTAGAPISFALLMTLGPALTALTAFWWLRRHTGRPFAAALGGLIVAFSPFVAGHLLGHLNLVFLPLIPLILMLLEDLLWRAPRPTRRTVAYLAVATAAQIGISEELLLILGVAVLVALVAGTLIAPRMTMPAVRRALPPTLVAAGICAVLTSPIWVSQLVLTRPVSLQSQRFHAVPSDYVHSVKQQLWNTAGGHRSLLGGAENGVYLGWPLVVILTAGIVLTWRGDRLVRIAAVTAVAMVSLTLGIDGLGPVWLPWRALQHVPNFASVLPARFAMATWLVVGWLISRWMARLGDRLATSQLRRQDPVRAGIASVAAAALTVAPLASLTPGAIGTFRAPRHVPFFTSAAERRLIPPGGAILLLPIAWPGDAEAMYYQQLAGFRFREAGGYALSSDARSLSDTDLLRRLGQPGLHAGRMPRGHPPATVSIAEGRAALARIHPMAIVVVMSAANAPELVTLAGQLTGRPADLSTGGVSVWLLHPAGHDSP